MSEPIRTDLPDGGFILTWPDGRQQRRDARGKIVSSPMSSERAKELSKLATKKRWSKDESVSILLSEAGFDDGDNPPPEAVRLLAEQFAKGGSGAIAAARELFRYTKQEPITVDKVRLQPHEQCTRCGRLGLTLSPDMAARILKIIRMGDKPIITDKPESESDPEPANTGDSLEV